MFRSRIPGPAPLHNKAVRADGGTAVETVLIPRGGKHSCTDGSRREEKPLADSSVQCCGRGF
jgi:hypothetical protein